MMPHGMMFHHFYDDSTEITAQGAISAAEFAEIIEFVGPEKILSANEWMERALTDTLKESDTCITFDDSLLCQYKVALPVLEHYGIKAFWFVYTAVFEGKLEILEIYRKFRTVSFDSVESYYDNFFKSLESSDYAALVREGLKGFDVKEFLSNCPFYSDGDRKYRFVRDNVLGPDRYRKILDMMMLDKGIDIKEFSKDLWMSADNIRHLYKEGHVIGLHSHTHPTSIKDFTREEQRMEYHSNFESLKAIIGTPPKTVSYPCNSYNSDTGEILEELSIELGFRADMTHAALSHFEFPREDHANILNEMRK